MDQLCVMFKTGHPNNKKSTRTRINRHLSNCVLQKKKAKIRQKTFRDEKNVNFSTGGGIRTAELARVEMLDQRRAGVKYA